MRSRNYVDKLKEVGLITLEERRTRIIQGVDNVETGTWFAMANEREREGATSTRNNRDTTRLVEGNSNYELRRNFFSQRVPSRWNALPQATRQQITVLRFKAAFDGTTLRQPGLT